MFTITPKLAGIVAAAACLLMAPAAFAAGPHKSVTAASKAAAIEALQRRSVDLDAAYRKLYPRAYRQAVRKNVEAGAWNFPSCTPSPAAEFDPNYSGDPCISTAPAGSTVGPIVLAPAIENGAVSSAPVSPQGGAFCNGNAEYDYIYSGCQS